MWSIKCQRQFILFQTSSSKFLKYYLHVSCTKSHCKIIAIIKTMGCCQYMAIGDQTSTTLMLPNLTLSIKQGKTLTENQCNSGYYQHGTLLNETYFYLRNYYNSQLNIKHHLPCLCARSLRVIFRKSNPCPWVDFNHLFLFVETQCYHPGQLNDIQILL